MRSPDREPLPTVLVVDDDERIRRLTARMLMDCGYTVLTAGDGLEALGLLQRDGRPIHLVVTDLRMPRMNGHELALRVGRLSGPPRLLFITGYLDGVEPGHLPGPLLTKPFTMELLVSTVRTLLAGV